MEPFSLYAPCVLVETKGYEILRNMTGAEFCSDSESVLGYVWFPDRRKLTFSILLFFCCCCLFGKANGAKCWPETG